MIFTNTRYKLQICFSVITVLSLSIFYTSQLNKTNEIYVNKMVILV
jgi:hypothetical protein